MCLTCAIIGTIIQETKYADNELSYLELAIGDNNNWNTSWILMILKQTGTWILIFT